MQVFEEVALWPHPDSGSRLIVNIGGLARPFQVRPPACMGSVGLGRAKDTYAFCLQQSSLLAAVLLTYLKSPSEHQRMCLPMHACLAGSHCGNPSSKLECSWVLIIMINFLDFPHSH